MLAHAVKRDADLPLNLKAEDIPSSPCEGTTMCEDYAGDEVSMQPPAPCPAPHQSPSPEYPRTLGSPASPQDARQQEESPCGSPQRMPSTSPRPCSAEPRRRDSHGSDVHDEGDNPDSVHEASDDDSKDLRVQDLRHPSAEDEDLQRRRRHPMDSMHQEEHLDSKAGVLAGLANLQHLQSLAGLQGLQGLQSLSQGLQGLQGLGPGLGQAPLNLSLSAAGSVSAAPGLSSLLLGAPPGPAPGAPPLGPHGPPPAAPAPAPPQLPQLILASGQLVQGIQGAQVLIPTSHGIATQTVLTIPVSHASSGQLVNVALSNGQVVSTTLGHLQTLAAQQQQQQPPGVNGLVPAPAPVLPAGLPSHLTNGSSLQPHHGHQLPLHHHPQQPHQSHQPQPPQQPPPQQQQQPQQQAPQLPPQQPTQATQRLREQRERDREQRDRREREREVEREREREREREPIHPAHRPTQLLSHHHYQVPEKNHVHNNGLLNGIASSISRLAANNCDLTITTTNAPAASSSPPQAHSFHNNNNSTNVNNNNRHSPLQLQLKGNNTGCGGGGSQHSGSSTSALSPVSDLLDDNPNQPTINQANTNVVDGINLDEIKEFAKAFKLRRLSLGLTQTQVGQALSITEGPAYSQSAICSALATQMICAAQIANQRPNVFEKLDITPKSAQKIKPVLEHWMKEAEERYKIGQNHLTEFIGMEPSKKRKRRTSFTPQALELLNAHFERNTHPSGTEITALAHQLGYDREVIRIWFCNKRQALKNTVRMMSKGLVS